MIRVIDLAINEVETDRNNYAQKLQDAIENQRKRLLDRFKKAECVGVVLKYNTTYVIFECTPYFSNDFDA